MYGDRNRTQIGPKEAAELAAVKADPKAKSSLVTSAAAADAALETWRAALPQAREGHEPAENC